MELQEKWHLAVKRDDDVIDTSFNDNELFTEAMQLYRYKGYEVICAAYYLMDGNKLAAVKSLGDYIR